MAKYKAKKNSLAREFDGLFQTYKPRSPRETVRTMMYEAYYERWMNNPNAAWHIMHAVLRRLDQGIPLDEEFYDEQAKAEGSEGETSPPIHKSRPTLTTITKALSDEEKAYDDAVQYHRC